MLFRSRLRTGARKEISIGGRSSTLLVVLTLIALVTSGSAPSKALRDALANANDAMVCLVGAQLTLFEGGAGKGDAPVANAGDATSFADF